MLNAENNMSLAPLIVTLQVNLGTGDLVNLGMLGKILIPSARLCSIGPTGHALATYLSTCQ